MVDYSALLYDPVYAALGVPATLIAGTAGEVIITVYDDTRRKSQTGGGLETLGVGPVVFARMPELTAKGITRDDLLGSLLIFNGRSWVVRSSEPCGSPNGEDFGELQIFLKAVESTDG